MSGTRPREDRETKSRRKFMIGNNPERNKAIRQLLHQGAKNERMVLWALSNSEAPKRRAVILLNFDHSLERK